jgi:hypothetical protein
VQAAVKLTYYTHSVLLRTAGEYLASCSQDGTVVVSNLQPDGRSDKATGNSSGGSVFSSSSLKLEEVYTYGAPMLAVRLDPLYARRREKSFVAGGAGGKVQLQKLEV